MAVGTFPWASWRASDRRRRIAAGIAGPPCDGATMPRAGGHRQDGESRGLTLNYTSHIPCNGVEEPKSAETYGIGIQVALDSPEGILLVLASEPSDLVQAGVS